MSALPKRRKPSFQLGLLGAIALFLVLGPGLSGISGSSFTQTEARPITDQAPIWRQNVLTLPLQLNPNDNDNYNRQLVQSVDEQDIDTTYLLQKQQQHHQQNQQREGGSDETLQLYKSHSHHQHTNDKQKDKKSKTQNVVPLHRTSGLKMDRQHWDFVHLASKVSGKSTHRVNQRLRHEWEKHESKLREAIAKKANKIKSSGPSHASKDVSRQEQRSDKTKKTGQVKGESKAKHQVFKTQGILEGQKTSPAIFYVPHQDDDALAMALAIREHIESGRRVIVHLYSDGINAMLRDIVAGAVPCPLQHPPHRFKLTLSDVVTGRTHEFRQSLRALGVQDQDIFETGWSDIEPLKDYAAFKQKLRDLIVGYEQKYPGASHKCISGEYDRDAVGRNPTHRACWDVATDLLNEFPRGYPISRQLWDFRFYRTYTYYNPPARRSAQYVRALPRYLAYKQHALDQYKRWDPSKGELAWGYHSVKSLIDAAYNDEHVYMDMLDNDPTNPENWSSGGRNKAELEVINTEGEATMFPDTLDNRKKDTNIMLFRGKSKMRAPKKHGKSYSQRKGDRVQGHGHGVKESERLEEQDVEETHIFGDYDIDESGLEAKIGGQSMGTNAYNNHDVGESGLNTSPKDVNLMLLKKGPKTKTAKKHGKSPSQRKGDRAQGHGHGVKENGRLEEQDVEETHIFGDYDIDESGLEAKIGGQSMGTNAYNNHDVGESGLNTSPKDVNLMLLKKGPKTKTAKKHGKSPSQRKGDRAQGHGHGVKENGRLEEQDVEETHIFGDYDIDESGLEAKIGGQSMGTNAYNNHDVGESGLNTSPKDVNLMLLKKGPKTKTAKKHGKSPSQRKGDRAQGHGHGVKENGRLEEQDVEETHIFGDYDIDESGLEAKIGGQSVGTNAYGNYASDDSEMETVMVAQNAKETHAYGDYNIDDSEMEAAMASYSAKEALAYHDAREAKVAAVPDNIMLLAKQQGSPPSTSAHHTSDDQDQMERNEDKNKDQILKQFDAVTKRPEGKDYKGVDRKHGSSIILGLVESDSPE
ncbi:hypothetical protein BGZ72_008150 [Mortierella alpina]|nr:hypothetical protein BGZ72_008150 [Mortierella alpina]